MVEPDENKTAPLIGGRYRAIRKIAAGQMGEVIEAEDVVLRKRVAVKIIRREHADAPDFADRLRLEAQAVAAVKSPHVVSALDLGRAPDGRAYVVFERLDGRTLRDELRERKHVPPAEAIALMLELLDGLAAAHEAGIIHRDIKHENVFLCAPARPGGERILKILDFGLAKVIDPSAAGAPSPLALPTAKGMILGTPRFLAPEQILGQAVDHRADLYSAGIVLYMLLAGRDPFHRIREVYGVLAAQVKTAPEPPSTQAEQPVPEALDRIVLRALAKAPEDRFPDAKAFAAALAEVARAPEPSRTRWAETERVDLRAFRAPSPAAVAKTMQLPSAATQIADDETAATLPLAALRAPASLAITPELERAQGRYSRAQIVAAILFVVVFVALDVAILAAWLRR